MLAVSFKWGEPMDVAGYSWINIRVMTNAVEKIY